MRPADGAPRAGHQRPAFQLYRLGAVASVDRTNRRLSVRWFGKLDVGQDIPIWQSAGVRSMPRVGDVALVIYDHDERPLCVGFCEYNAARKAGFVPASDTDPQMKTSFPLSPEDPAARRTNVGETTFESPYGQQLIFDNKGNYSLVNVDTLEGVTFHKEPSELKLGASRIKFEAPGCTASFGDARWEAPIAGISWPEVPLSWPLGGIFTGVGSVLKQFRMDLRDLTKGLTTVRLELLNAVDALTGMVRTSKYLQPLKVALEVMSAVGIPMCSLTIDAAGNFNITSTLPTTEVSITNVRSFNVSSWLGEATIASRAVNLGLAGMVPGGEALMAPAMWSTAFLPFYNAHFHIAPPLGGPTSSPVPPAIPFIVTSKSVKVGFV